MFGCVSGRALAVVLCAGGRAPAVVRVPAGICVLAVVCMTAGICMPPGIYGPADVCGLAGCVTVGTSGCGSVCFDDSTFLGWGQKLKVWS